MPRVSIFLNDNRPPKLTDLKNGGFWNYVSMKAPSGPTTGLLKRTCYDPQFHPFVFSADRHFDKHLIILFAKNVAVRH